MRRAAVIWGCVINDFGAIFMTYPTRVGAALDLRWPTPAAAWPAQIAAS